MSNVKMGLTIEEGRQKSDYPQGYAGAFYERQSGQKSSQSE